MARPKKNTVDYFPHSCVHGKTMFVIENKFGNDGYSVWYKTLEELGKADGHFLDLRDDGFSEYLFAKFRVSAEKTFEILDLAAKLGAIDGKLWEMKVIWSENFVQGIEDVYKKRTTETPTKPSFRTENPKPKKVSGSGNPQSKGKETKPKHSSGDPDDFFTTFWKSYPKKKDKVKAQSAWLKVKPADYEKLFVGLEAHKKSKDWLKDKGQFIPLPATFLNNRRWEDVQEVEVDSNAAQHEDEIERRIEHYRKNLERAPTDEQVKKWRDKLKNNQSIW